jgi:DNA-directed RNA polymerase specialized sigma24 family protein
MVSYAKTEKRQCLGYEAEDEAFYGLTQIAEILPSVMWDEPEPPRSAGSEIRSTSDPAEGGNWLASWLDVKHALNVADLSARERSTLLALYADGESQASWADMLGVTAQAVQQTNTRALRKLQRVLGGERDKGCPYQCECHSYRQRP